MRPDVQDNFSALYPAAVADREGRVRKARTVRAVLEDHFGPGALGALDVLDVGASTGVIDAWLANHVRSVCGLDVDRQAIEAARRDFVRPNLSFQIASALALPFADGTFDVVLNMHVYEHVADAERLMAEVHRVLKPGGVCYFAAGNRVQWMEPHYRLPLLSVLPHWLAHRYLRVLGRGRYYYERHRTYWGLRHLAQAFTVHDYTQRMVDDPDRFQLTYLFAGHAWKTRLAQWAVRLALPLMPGYVWLLEKSSGGRGQAVTDVAGAGA